VINAQKELIEHIEGKEVEYVKISFGGLIDRYKGNSKIIEGRLEKVLESLNFNYDRDCFASPELFGFIWYKDGTWSEREEHSSAESWVYKSRPDFGVDLSEL
tara:strand:- start:103 stop:408 length:306 start_codon:yes stop_codon:yes gene_type:complete